MIWHWECCLTGVIGLALLIVAGVVVVMAITLEVFAPSVAPLGYQDETGFHAGTPRNAEEDGLGWNNPS
jgi:hypothetical protein